MSGTSPPTNSVVGSPYSPSDGLASRDHAITPACFAARPLAVLIARFSVRQSSFKSSASSFSFCQSAPCLRSSVRACFGVTSVTSVRCSTSRSAPFFNRLVSIDFFFGPFLFLLANRSEQRALCIAVPVPWRKPPSVGLLSRRRPLCLGFCSALAVAPRRRLCSFRLLMTSVARRQETKQNWGSRPSRFVIHRIQVRPNLPLFCGVGHFSPLFYVRHHVDLRHLGFLYTGACGTCPTRRPGMSAVVVLSSGTQDMAVAGGGAPKR